MAGSRVGGNARASVLLLRDVSSIQRKGKPTSSPQRQRARWVAASGSIRRALRRAIAGEPGFAVLALAIVDPPPQDAELDQREREDDPKQQHCHRRAVARPEPGSVVVKALHDVEGN